MLKKQSVKKQIRMYYKLYKASIIKYEDIPIYLRKYIYK
jgi:hypothetical protein